MTLESGTSMTSTTSMTTESSESSTALKFERVVGCAVTTYMCSVAILVLSAVVGSLMFPEPSPGVAAACSALGAMILVVPFALLVTWGCAAPPVCVRRMFAIGMFGLVAIIDSGLVGAAILRPVDISGGMLLGHGVLGFLVFVSFAFTFSVCAYAFYKLVCVCLDVARCREVPEL